MRVDFTAAAEVNGFNPSSGVATKHPAGSTVGVGNNLPEDKASISSRSLSIPSLTSQALAASEARVAKVEALRRAVVGSEYPVDPALIADALANASV